MVYAVAFVGVLALFYLLMTEQAQASSMLVSEIERKIIIYAGKYDVESAIVKAVVRVESNFNPTAKNPSDPSYGLMQVTPGLAQDFGFSNWQPPLAYNIDNNLDVGCWFLSRLLSKYSFDQAIQSYNVGERGYFLGRRNINYLNKVRSYYGSYK